MSRFHLIHDTSSPERWTLDRPYERQTSIGPIVVPQGFETDLASIPWQLWRALPRLGPYSGASIVHDWLYRTQPSGVGLWQADRLFLELMKADRVTRGESLIIYRAVREFGDLAWRGHQETRTS